MSHLPADRTALGIIVVGGFVAASMLVVSCAGSRPTDQFESETSFAPCPSSPNCVSSDARDGTHSVPALRLAVAPAEAWRATREIASELPRSRIAKETANYLHIECRSALFGFVDDLELELRPGEGIIAVRSASRLGYSDLGVNRRRIEAVRASLINRGTVL